LDAKLDQKWMTFLESRASVFVKFDSRARRGVPKT
jgi:hypothetical protein